MKDDGTTPVGHLCPALAEVARILRRNTAVGHPDRAEAMLLLRQVRMGVHQLRENEVALRKGKL